MLQKRKYSQPESDEVTPFFCFFCSAANYNSTSSNDDGAFLEVKCFMIVCGGDKSEERKRKLSETGEEIATTSAFFFKSRI